MLKVSGFVGALLAISCGSVAGAACGLAIIAGHTSPTLTVIAIAAAFCLGCIYGANHPMVAGGSA